MPKKITIQKGYPTSDGKSFPKYDEAMKHQAKLDLDEAVDACGETTSISEFITKNPEVVTDFIKYNCKKPKPAARKKSAASKEPLKSVS